MFPYNCDICGGGYNRCGARCSCEAHEDCTCGYAEHLPCDGGQFCWEEEVYFQVRDDPMNDPECAAALGRDRQIGTYNGYGEIQLEDAIDYLIVPIEFKEDFDGPERVVFVDVWCKSCIDGREK
jgi:hypothetical protein